MISCEAIEALKKIEEYHNEIVYDIGSTYTENIFENEINTIRKALRKLKDLERTIDILDTCTNVLDDLKENTSKEEYEFVEKVFRNE